MTDSKILLKIFLPSSFVTRHLTNIFSLLTLVASLSAVNSYATEGYEEVVINYDEEEIATAQQQQGPNTTSIGISNVRLNPGGNMSVAGPVVHESSGEWTQRRAVVDYYASGSTTRSVSPSVFASIDLELLEKGLGATTRYGFAEVNLTYFVYIGLDPDTTIEGGLDFLDVPIQMVSYAFKNSEGGGDAVATLELRNLTRNQSLIQYTTLEDPTIETNSDDAVKQTYTLDNGEIQAFNMMEIRLTALAEGLIDNSFEPDAITFASAEAYVDPYFLFDQAAYDLSRLADPSLPDIQLADVFQFQVSSNIYAAPVPLPASWLFLSSALVLIRMVQKRR